jgi:hypothetical protein
MRTAIAGHGKAIVRSDKLKLAAYHKECSNPFVGVRDMRLGSKFDGSKHFVELLRYFGNAFTYVAEANNEHRPTIVQISRTASKQLESIPRSKDLRTKPWNQTIILINYLICST